MKKSMKVIDAERLKAEVKSWRDKQMGFSWDAVNEVGKMILSLQKELPTLQELDAAAIAYSKRVSDGRMYRDLIAGFIAGAEWMAEQIKEDKR